MKKKNCDLLQFLAFYVNNLILFNNGDGLLMSALSFTYALCVWEESINNSYWQQPLYIVMDQPGNIWIQSHLHVV